MLSFVGKQDLLIAPVALVELMKTTNLSISDVVLSIPQAVDRLSQNVERLQEFSNEVANALREQTVQLDKVRFLARYLGEDTANEG